MTFEKHSEEDWERIRKSFSNSALKTTEIAELGRNVGISWPFKGSGETPEKYIQFNFEELHNVPGLIGKKKRVKDLMDILSEILAFDDPFSDMMDTVDERSAEHRRFKRVLRKLQIPENYPIEFMYFSPETREILKNGSVKTLIEIIDSGQNTIDAVQNDDELQVFLNGLALANEATIKKHLPYRLGVNGLHLPEATGLLIRDLSRPVKLELLNLSGSPLSDEDKTLLERANEEPLEASVKTALGRFDSLCAWFAEEIEELRQLDITDGSLKRYFLPINNLQYERIAVAMLKIKFNVTQPDRSGLIGKFSRLFKR